MSKCLDVSMTGSMNSGLLMPQKDSSTLPAKGTAPFDRHSTPESPSTRQPGRKRVARKMTLAPSSGQPIQLTPLWEHVVRTRRFPPEVDTRLTFLEISERLRDPEWEVRQHALRVLMDVLLTLNAEVIDKVMQPVVPELINNLGHPAPAVRKGALDTMRVYLVHSRDRDETVKKILQDGLNRSDGNDPFQTNVTTGVILSAPSLLFPSSSSPSPNPQLVKDTTIALASRLAQVPHQEAVLKSLTKIRDAVGAEKFDAYIADYDNKLIKNIEILSKIYNIKPSRKTQKRNRGNATDAKNLVNLHRDWDSDSDTSGIVEEEDEVVNAGSMPQARVVLETEIKFNEETAITMTILEEKADNSENEQDEESGTDVRNEADVGDSAKGSAQDKKRAQRRVHFGGEVVKLRTPDSDEMESMETKTKIPLPISPATKMPERSRRKPSSQPCSPNRENGGFSRTSRSVSNSPKREFYTHNAELSPKKGILTRTNSPLLIVKPAEQQPRKKKKKKKSAQQDDKALITNQQHDSSEAKENPVIAADLPSEQVEGFARKSEVRMVAATNNLSEGAAMKDEERKRSAGKAEVVQNKRETSTPEQKSISKASKKEEECQSENNSALKEERSPRNSSEKGGLQRSPPRVANKNPVFETFPRQERNYILMELSSPEKKTDKEEKNNNAVAKTSEGDDKLFEGNSTNEKTNNNASENAQRSPQFPNPIQSPFGALLDNVEFNEQFTNESYKRSTKSESQVDINYNEDEDVLNEDEVTASKVEVLKLIKEESLADGKANEENSGQNNNKVDRDSSRNGDSERTSRSDRDKRSAIVIAKKQNVVHAEGRTKSGEPSWEELGLVNREVLEDLHNKEDWRARVRGLERVASALRTSSALIAIESRLGSLLHAVLGCERSCRVAAAGLAVAKVVVAGVSEDALKRRLPQLAWGLARQGGPNAAQLARIAMLRLRPALLLEQLLQPHCLNARNAKTRENALQLLIFSLVTFPSTEFKVETVANKVAKVVGDRRRRVRQAALDTLAVLAQIYEPEEVLAAGKRAAIGRHDGESMISAIRARLARKSLPLVSADGLVVYGLQISPTVQIATGSDVDWIVAGSGSVSPGTGRTRGQIIATSKSEKGRISRNENTKTRENPWIERPNLVAQGVGLHSETGQAVAWQIVANQNQDKAQYEDQSNQEEARITNAEVQNARESTSVRNTGSAAKEKETGNKAESRIPVLFSRDRGTKSSGQSQERSVNFQLISANSKRRGNHFSESSGSQTESRVENIGSHNAIQNRKKGVQENTSSRISVTSQVANQPFDSHYQNRQGALRRNIQKSVNASSEQYNLVQRKDSRFVKDNTFRAIHTASIPLTRIYSGEQNFNRLSETRAYQRTRNVAAQKVSDIELASSDTQTNPGTYEDTPYRRRLRSLSPSQLYRRQQFVKMASTEFHTMSMYDIDKAGNEEEYNERNKHHLFQESGYHLRALNTAGIQFEVDDRERRFAKSASSTSSSENNRQKIIEQGSNQENYNDSGSSTPQSPNPDAAFDIITSQSNPPCRDTVDSYFDPLGEKIETVLEPEDTLIDDESSKDSSSDEENKIKFRSQAASRLSERPEFIEGENQDESDSTFEKTEENVQRTSARRRSIVSVISNDRLLINEVFQTSSDAQISPARKVGSPKKAEELFLNKSPSHKSEEFEASKSPSARSSRGSPRKLSFDHVTENLRDSSEDREISSTINDDNHSLESLEPIQARTENSGESPTIIIASRPHSSEPNNAIENNIEISAELDDVDNARAFLDDSTNDTLEDGQSKDSASETNTEPGILKIETPVEALSSAKKISSKVPRSTGRFKSNLSKGHPEKNAEKLKPTVQQCFTQLDNKDWEITMKGLKSLSQIAKQHPEYLDVCAAGTIGRLLGRHIKNLRSQVARAACLAASDIFSSQIRGIDQDIDDIAGPLLHRTADTNRFLRADSNAALDQMVLHLPPHKTIGIIVHRGANHQNAIVRAATARLLVAIVERVGSEHAMILPRDVRDKLLNAGARLLMDGNLDARNHAKKMFRRLTRCEGFRRALTDAVPENTLRHIEKTLKSL